ncbi:MAG TPA: ABC transporter ATP-binding protein [Candidatus Paceibacterota bacterium]|nr:ABC transporter ATP-binding protein [Candidatus Paceibacterota bacterium]
MATRTPDRSSLDILAHTFRGYLWYFIAVTALGTLTALIDGVSIASIIPIVSFLIPSTATVSTTVTHVMQVTFSILHIPFKFFFMLLFVSCLIITRAVLMALFVLLRGIGSGRFLSYQIDSTYTSLLNVRWQFALREKAGHLQNIVLWDTKRAGQLLDGIVQFLQSVTGFLIYLALAVFISPFVTFLALGAGAVLIFILRPFMYKTRQFADETARLEKDIAQHIGEHIQGFKTVKASGVVPQALSVARAYLTRFRELAVRAIFVQSLGSIFIQPFGFIFAMGVFAFSYYSGNFNIAAFAATLYLIQKIFVYLDSTQSSFSMVIQYIPFAESVLSFKARTYAEREEDAVGAQHFAFEKDIVFDKVSLRHEGGAEALSDASFVIKKGQFVGIVGPSGSGKTSLADLLLRLFTPTTGTIKADGISISNIRMSEWRRSIGYVSQDSFLLHASIRENIRFYDESITEADIDRAIREAQLFDFIKSLPEGLDTILGDRGVTLSGGQRQRVALARTLARHPSILVMDEVTSALDSELEEQIQAVISELHGSITLVVVAHRVSTVVNADEIIVLKDGVTMEQGAPSAMLSNPDSYLSRIVGLQGGNQDANR